MNSQRGLLARSAGWLIIGSWFLCQGVLIAWATLAIYYSNLPWPWLRLVLAGAFAAFAIWALFLSRQRLDVPCRNRDCFLAWLCGGSPFLPRMIAIGVRKSP